MAPTWLRPKVLYSAELMALLMICSLASPVTASANTWNVKTKLQGDREWNYRRRSSH